MLETIVLLYIFFGGGGNCVVFLDSLINKKFKRTAFIKKKKYKITINNIQCCSKVWGQHINTFIQEGCAKWSNSKDLLENISLF